MGKSGRARKRAARARYIRSLDPSDVLADALVMGLPTTLLPETSAQLNCIVYDTLRHLRLEGWDIVKKTSSKGSSDDEGLLLEGKLPA